MKKKHKESHLKNIIINNIIKNKKEYLIVIILFIIGITIGIYFINNTKIDAQIQIQDYFKNFINKIKNGGQINKSELLKLTLKQNILSVIIIGIVSASIIGIPIAYGFIIYNGFCFGYTISSIIASLGIYNGILTIFSGLFFQKIIFIPAIIILTVSGIKVSKLILKERKKENIKIEILRHLIFLIIIEIIVIIASLIESFIVSVLLKQIIKMIVL